MLEKIRHMHDQLSGAEARVAGWVLQQPHTAISASLATAADQSGASEPTVIRFCRSLGCSGFREFKVQLARTLAGVQNYVHHDIGDGDQAPEIIAKIAERTIHELTKTRDNLSPRAVDDAAVAMAAARQIQFIGVGASGIVASDAQHKFFRLGVPCIAHIDGPTIMQSAAIAGADDCIVAISNSGQSSDLLESCEMLADGTTTLIAITASSSPLSRLADIVLDVDTYEVGNVYTPTNSRLAHLLVLDILQVSLALTIGEHATDNLRRANEILKSRSTKNMTGDRREA